MEPSMKLCQLIHQLETSDRSMMKLIVGVSCGAQYVYGFDSVLVKPYIDTNESRSGIAIMFLGSQNEHALNLEKVIALLKVHIRFYGEQVLKVEHVHSETKFRPTKLLRAKRDDGAIDLIFS